MRDQITLPGVFQFIADRFASELSKQNKVAPKPISLEAAYQNFRPNSDDYGDELLAQEPLNNIPQLPAAEEQPTTESEEQ